MDTRTYPGKGLSLSQLVFALNEELKRAAYSPSYTFNDVSQLDQDTSIALTAIREWRNSFIHINRIPLDVLSLVPTHLHSQQDRFRASFVCRHWRRVFLQHAPLWSQLFLSKGEVYVKTLLERAKGSALDIIASHNNPVDAVVLLPPHTQQIRHLSFVSIPWVDIQMFSVTNPGPFPVIRTLTIETAIDTDINGSSLMAPPSLPLFSNAVDLKEFVLRSEGSPFLNHFVFPNLTTFELLGAPVEGLRASELLDFLEASPTLRTVQMKIISGILLGDVSRERMVVLPNVETFSLAMDYGGPGYELATYISCPSVGQTSFMHEIIADHILPQQMFPSSVSWNAIVRQYTRDLIEEVTFRVEFSHIVTCSLVFRSPATVIRLDFNVSESDEEEVLVPYRVLFHEVFSQAFRTVRDHPSLPNVKRLNINYRACFMDYRLKHIANEVGRLFKSVGPLDELTISGCDLHSYLAPFLDLPEFNDMEQPIVFPPIKELKISHPLMLQRKEECLAAIVELAKSQHALGIPFERLTVCMEEPPTAMEEMLRPWVGSAVCINEWCPDDD